MQLYLKSTPVQHLFEVMYMQNFLLFLKHRYSNYFCMIKRFTIVIISHQFEILMKVLLYILKTKYYIATN